MHIFWVILAEFFITICNFLEMKFLEKRGFSIWGIEYGFKPILYKKTIKNFDFSIGIIPFFGGLVAIESDTEDYRPKWLSSNVYSFLCNYGFLSSITLIFMVVLTFISCGMDFTVMILKIFFLLGADTVELSRFSETFNGLNVTMKILVSISVYISIFYLYAGFLRNIIYSILSLIFKTITSSTQYVISTVLLYNLFKLVPNEFFGVLLNFDTFTPFLLLDWFIGHLIFVTIVGLIIEIYSRKYALEE